jgi:hypothetical protein
MTRTVLISLELHEGPTVVVEFMRHGMMLAVSKYPGMNDECVADIMRWLEDGEL